MNPSKRVTRAFTLIEMMVVIAILVALAGMVLPNLASQQDFANLQMSESGNKDLSNGILGIPGTQDINRQPIASGFSADIGRLPKATGGVLTTAELNAGFFRDADLVGTSSPTQLSELWLKPETMMAYDLQRLTTGDLNYADVKLACGWHGPYISSAIRVASNRFDTTKFNTGYLGLNGFDHAYQLYKSDDTRVLSAADPIAYIRSPGVSGPNASGLATDPYEQEMPKLVFPAAPGFTVMVHVENITVAKGELHVYLFEPDVVKSFSPLPAGTPGVTSNIVLWTPTDVIADITVPSTMTPGPRALRIIQGALPASLPSASNVVTQVYYFNAHDGINSISVRLP